MLLQLDEFVLSPPKDRMPLRKAQKPAVGLHELYNRVVYCITVRKKLTAVRLKPAQVEKLEKISIREDVPVSWLIRKAIDQFLKRQK